MKVVRGDFDRGGVEWGDVVGFDMDHTVVVLKQSFDEKKTVASDCETLALEEIWGEDDVGDAGFVFEGEKDEAFCCAGALPRDDAACDTNLRIVGEPHQVRSRKNAFRAQFGAVIGHRVRPGGEARAGVVGN